MLQILPQSHNYTRTTHLLTPDVTNQGSTASDVPEIDNIKYLDWH